MLHFSQSKVLMPQSLLKIDSFYFFGTSNEILSLLHHVRMLVYTLPLDMNHDLTKGKHHKNTIN